MATKNTPQMGELDAFMQGEAAANRATGTRKPQKPSFQKPNMRACDETGAENDLSGKPCPLCGQPLVWRFTPAISAYAFSHEGGKCKAAIKTVAEYEKMRKEQRQKESDSSKHPLREKKAQSTSEAEEGLLADAEFIRNDESEEELKQRLGLFSDKEKEIEKDDSASKKKTQMRAEQEGKGPIEKRMPDLKKNAKKLRSKMETFTEEQEEEVQQKVNEKKESEGAARKAIIIRRTIEVEKEETKPQREESSEKTETAFTGATGCEEEENLGKTQLLVPQEAEISMQAHPSLTDLQTGEIFEIKQPETLIGRSKKCQIQIKDGVISHEHAHLILKNDKAYLRDDGSSNGTFLLEGEEEDAFKLPKGHEVELKDGCLLLFANRKYQFSMEV